MAAPHPEPGFLQELRRRRVFRVILAYAVGGWALVEVADTAFPRLGLPDVSVTFVLAAFLLGFPLVVLLAWAFDLTPEGIRRTEPAAPGQGWPFGIPPRLALVALGAPAVVSLLLLGARALRSPQVGPSSSPPAPVDANRPSLAVLPFADLSGEDTGAFTDGVGDDIRMQLGRLPDLRVIGRTSVQRYRSSHLSAREIGAELGVTHVLEGSVERSGDRIRIRVGLVRVGPDVQLWSDSYDRYTTDVFAIQTDVAEQVASALLDELSPPHRDRLGARAADLRAYEVHLAARALLERRSMAGLRRALELFREAIRLDPTYAPAHVGLADTYLLLSSWGGLSAAEAGPPALDASERALALDPLSGEAWTSRAYLHAWFERDWAAAEEAFLRALELSPSYPTAHHWYAVVLAVTGRLREAEAAIQRARALDPGSLIILTISGLVRHFARDWEGAIELHRQSLDLEPDYPVGHLWLAQALAGQGRLTDALDHYRRAAAIDPSSPLMQCGLAYGLARTGDLEGAREVMARLEASVAPGRVPPYWLAQARVGLGEHEEAIRVLERGLADGTLMGNTFMEPLLDPLRDDPRFQAVIEGLGLATAGR